LGSPVTQQFIIAGGIIGALLLVFGLILSIYGLSVGSTFALFGLILLVIALILFVAATNGIDVNRGGGIYSGP
jgi:uncharacterized protein (DUF58 family)